MIVVPPGSTNVSIEVFIQDSTSTSGAGLTGLVFNSAGLTCYYSRPGAAAVSIPLVTQTVAGAHTDGGFVAVSAANKPGVYRLDVPDLMVAAGVNSAYVFLQGAANMVPCPETILLTTNWQTNVVQWAGHAVTADLESDIATIVSDIAGVGGGGGAACVYNASDIASMLSNQVVMMSDLAVIQSDIGAAGVVTVYAAWDATSLTICNQALALLGEKETLVTDLDNPTNKPERLCALFYHNARREMLRYADWRVARKVDDLVVISGDPELEDRWEYKYTVPTDLLKPLRVTDTADYSRSGYPYEMMTQSDGTHVLLTNIEDAYLVYTFDLTTATTFTEDMITVLMYMLAIKLARAIVGAKAGTIVQELRQQLREEIGPQAKAADGASTYVENRFGTTSWADVVISRPIL